jgi:hypothetical protein
MKPAPLPPLPPEDVRAALVHFTELAAAFEGRGYDLSFSTDEADLVLGDQWKTTMHWDPQEDEKALREVTNCLLAHLRKQRLVQRSGLFERLLAMLSDAYREHKAGTLDARHLFERVRHSCTSICLDLPDEQLELLASPTPEALRMGPVEAAKEAIAKLGVIGTRTLGSYRAQSDPFRTVRSAFGRFISMAHTAAYSAEVHRFRLAATPCPIETWDFLNLDNETDERDARVLDDLAEWTATLVFSSWEMFRSLLPEPLGDTIDLRLQEKVDRAVADVLAAIDRRDIACLAAGPVWASAMVYVRALDAGATRDQLEVLADAIKNSIREDLQSEILQRSAESIGPLSSPPDWWLETCAEPIQNRPVVDQSDGKREGGGIKG